VHFSEQSAQLPSLVELLQPLVDCPPGLAEARGDVNRPHVPAPTVIAGAPSHATQHIQAAYSVHTREHGSHLVMIRMIEQDDRAARRQADAVVLASTLHDQDACLSRSALTTPFA
jgi:hypothetical protein